MKKPIGFQATITWYGEGEPLSRYFSMGSWDEESNADDWGVRDDHIFFYLEGQDPLMFFLHDSGEDWQIESIDEVFFIVDDESR